MDKAVGEIKKVKAKRVGLQFPEGLKDQAVRIASEIEDRTKAKVLIFTDPTYGACDLKKSQCKSMKLDLMVHFGHTEYLR
jgi:2-(3-amino-3-carboxypropyl)histidine synthase